MYCRECGQRGEHDCLLYQRLLIARGYRPARYCPQCGSWLRSTGRHQKTWAIDQTEAVQTPSVIAANEARWCAMLRFVREQLEAGWRPLPKARWAWGNRHAVLAPEALRAVAEQCYFDLAPLYRSRDTVRLWIETKAHVTIFAELLPYAVADFLVFSWEGAMSEAALATWVPESVAAAGLLLKYPRRGLAVADIEFGAGPLFSRGAMLARAPGRVWSQILQLMQALAASGDYDTINRLSLADLDTCLKAAKSGVNMTGLVKEAGPELMAYVENLLRMI